MNLIIVAFYINTWCVLLTYVKYRWWYEFCFDRNCSISWNSYRQWSENTPTLLPSPDFSVRPFHCILNVLFHR